MMCSLRAAITEANSAGGADIITVPAGTYTQSLAGAAENANAGGDFDVTNPVSIEGAGAATTIIQSNAAPEAATERVDLKFRIFEDLDRLAPAGAILASNTSSISITEIAARTKRPELVIGMHFMNPVPLMQLVEVVRTVTTSPGTFEKALNFGRSLGKEAVAAKDNSGFIVNLLLVPYLLDAIRSLERGVGNTLDIDNAMKLGCGYPMGPFTLLDFVGNDTTYKIAEIMFDEYRETRYAPPALLKRMVLAGMYGRKSGKGFYDYSHNPPTPVDLGL